jgi:uncharacterized protein
VQASMRIDRDVPIEMRDGVILRADIYRPDDNKKHPAVVTRTPYNKLGGLSSAYFPVIEAVLAGYAVVMQDIRGRFASEGKYDAGADEGPDGYDSVEYLAAEPWCDGNVGMQGCSHYGMTQLMAAVRNPPHLKAINPQMYPDKPAGGLERSGTMNLGRSLWWTASQGIDVADKLEKQGKDVTELRRALEKTIDVNCESACNYLPINELPYLKVEGLAEIFKTRFNMNLNPTFPSEKITAAGLHCGGWYDLYIGPTLRIFQNIREHGASKNIRESQHLVFGPWSHGTVLSATVGDLHFGRNAGGGAALISQKVIRFFDKYLRGIDAAIPTVLYFVMGENRWHEADSWPLPHIQWQRFFLHSKGHANTSAGNGLLDREEPSAEPPDIFVYDPKFPIPTKGGIYWAGNRMGVPGPVDQSLVERRNDVLCYSTPELDEDIEITGPLQFHLFAASSAKDTDFSAKLLDVYPDGSAYNIAEGIIRARYHKSLTNPQLITQGDINEYIIDMAATSNVFQRGHRIRVDISSSNFPMHDRNMNTGNPFGVDAQGIPAMQTIYHQADYQSYIDIPMIPKRSKRV